VPLGSTEQHGPHLPLDTDSRVAVALARGAARRLRRAGSAVWVAPLLAYGASGEHAGFPGTLSIGTAALETVLVELARSAGPEIVRMVFVNGHGGNHEALTRAVARLRHEGRDVRAWAPVVEGGDAHAGWVETSLLLALHAKVVRRERLEAGNTEPLGALWPRLRAGGVRAVSVNGVLGDPRPADAERGRRLLRRLVADLTAAAVEGLAPAPTSRPNAPRTP
jgi:creatinine amidohydrolase